MIPDIAKHFFEALKLSPRYLVAIALVLAFLLFAPTELVQRFGVGNVAEDYRTGMGIGLLGCIALLAVTTVQWLYETIVESRSDRKFKRELGERLRRLTEDEKQILRYYLAKQTRSNSLRVDDGVVQGLAASGVIYRSSNMGSLLDGFAHNINEIAWDILHKDPALLQGSTNTYRTDKRYYGY